MWHDKENVNSVVLNLSNHRDPYSQRYWLRAPSFEVVSLVKVVAIVVCAFERKERNYFGISSHTQIFHW